MSEYRPRATRGDPMRGNEPPSTDRQARELYEWLDREAEDLPSGDMIGVWNDRKPRVLMDSPASSTSAVILATEVIVITAHPNEGPKSLSTTHEQ